MRVIGMIFLMLLTACGTTSQPVRSAPQPLVTATVAACVIQDGKADRRCTPGALNPEVTQDTLGKTICVKGWTATIRPPTKYTNGLKAIQMDRYGQHGVMSDYEEDHLVALELGGSPTDAANLWPEPWNGSDGAHVKDVEENALHTRVCARTMSLIDAQQTIIRDWTH